MLEITYCVVMADNSARQRETVPVWTHLVLIGMMNNIEHWNKRKQRSKNNGMGAKGQQDVSTWRRIDIYTRSAL